jgi:Domain of unknown function (DUF222)
MFGSLAEIAEEHRDLEARLAAWLKKVAAYERSDDWRAEGYVSAAAAIRVACNMNTGTARGHVDLARKLEDLPEVADAFGRGEISSRHAVVVANASTPERAAAISDVEAELVDVARQHTPRELGGVVRYLIDAIDGDGGGCTCRARSTACSPSTGSATPQPRKSCWPRSTRRWHKTITTSTAGCRRSGAWTRSPTSVAVALIAVNSVSPATFVPTSPSWSTSTNSPGTHPNS